MAVQVARTTATSSTIWQWSRLTTLSHPGLRLARGRRHSKEPAGGHRDLRVALPDQAVGQGVAGQPDRALRPELPCRQHQCQIIQFKPDGTLGYKELSIAANKEWDTGGGVEFNVRADILNVFNWVNYATFNGDTGTARDVNTAYATPTGVLASPMRAFGLNW